jgi:hypothetical protein
MLVAAAALVAGTLAAREALEAVLANDFAGQLVVVLVAGLSGAAIYIAMVFALRVEEARQLWALARGQVARLR